MLALALVLAACGGDRDGSADAPNPESGAERKQAVRKEAAVVPVYDRDGVLSRA